MVIFAGFEALAGALFFATGFFVTAFFGAAFFGAAFFAAGFFAETGFFFGDALAAAAFLGDLDFFGAINETSALSGAKKGAIIKVNSPVAQG